MKSIEFATAKRMLERQMERTMLLDAIVEAITKKTDLYSICKLALRDIGKNLPVGFASVLLWDSGAKRLVVYANDPACDQAAMSMGLVEGATLPLDGDILESPTSLADDDRLLQRFWDIGLREMTVEPLVNGGRLEGILLCAGREGQGLFADDRLFLRQLGVRVLLAIRHTRLASELEQACTDLERTSADMSRRQSKCLGQLARGIAHDLNNALAPIVGYAELILEDDRSMHPNSRGYLHNIREAARAVSGIVCRLRELSAVVEGEEAGQGACPQRTRSQDSEGRGNQSPGGSTPKGGCASPPASVWVVK